MYRWGGIIISFKDYSFRKGILGSPWVGLKYFKQFFGSPDIGMLLKNTLIISFLPADCYIPGADYPGTGFTYYRK